MSGLHSTVGRYGGADEWATQYSSYGVYNTIQ